VTKVYEKMCERTFDSVICETGVITNQGLMVRILLRELLNGV
jgi:hypothetical protein